MSSTVRFNSLKTSLVLAAGVASLLSASSVMAAVEPAPVFVKRISDTLIDRLVKERAAYQKNPAVLNTIVQENIEPHVDFDGFARGVMGRYYRQANATQRVAFEKTFRDSLIRTYARGLAAFNNESYTLRPFVPSNDSSRAMVAMDFKTDKGQTIPINYQLIQSGDSWKVRNVQLNGIDIGLTFRNQFASTVSSNRGDLDAAIRSFVPTAEPTAGR